MIRSIKRNMARQRMKEAGYTQINSRFARLWRDFVRAPMIKKRKNEHMKEWPGDRKTV